MGKRKGTIAITGANGFIGQYLTSSLAEHGVKVQGITRAGDTSRGYHALGPLDSNPAWEQCLNQVETVIHCAAMAHRPMCDRDLAMLYKVNRDAVADLAKTSMRCGVRRIIFLSSAKVYGEASDAGFPFHEADSPHPQDHYGESKLQAEAQLKACLDDQVEVCSLRLPLVYGPGVKANFQRLQRLAATGLPLPFAGTNNARSLLSLENLSRTILALMEMRSWPGACLNVADPDPISTPELLIALGEAQDKTVRLFPCPEGFLVWLGKALGRGETISKLIDSLELDTSSLKAWFPELQLLSTREGIGLHFGAASSHRNVKVA